MRHSRTGHPSHSVDLVQDLVRIFLPLPGSLRSNLSVFSLKAARDVWREVFRRDVETLFTLNFTQPQQEIFFFFCPQNPAIGFSNSLETGWCH